MGAISPRGGPYLNRQLAAFYTDVLGFQRDPIDLAAPIIVGTTVGRLPAMRMLLLVSCFFAANACLKEPPVGPSAPLNQQFTLPRGETISIDGTSVRLQFVQVTGDSRCPADVFCIQGGDALVHVRALDRGAAADYTLHTGDSARAAVTHRQLRIELVQLVPYPFSSRTIAQDDYRATLKVTAP